MNENIGEQAVSDKQQDAQEEVTGVQEPSTDKLPSEAVVESSTETAAVQATTPRRGSGFVAWLALILVLALAGGAVWYQQFLLQTDVNQAVRQAVQTQLAQSQQPQAEQLQRIDQRLATLESRKTPQPVVQGGLQQAQLDRLSQQLDQRLTNGIRPLEQRLQQQQQTLLSLEKNGQLQAEELSRLTADDRQKWLMAEAEYLLRLANQRLIMVADVRSAEALLSSADGVLREIDDMAFHPVRAAINSDIASLRALPKIDVEGLYLRLGALVGQADKLRVFKMQAQQQQSASDTPDDWQARLKHGYDAALDKLSNYIVIRRRDVPYQVLMDPQWESLVRQNLRMLLQQGQGALLLGKQALYDETLQRAGHWVGEFYAADEQGSKAMLAELGRLQQQTIEIALPDISASIHALDNVVAQRSREQ